MEEENIEMERSETKTSQQFVSRVSAIPGKHGGLTNYDMKRKALEDSLKRNHSRSRKQYEEGV